MVQWAVPSVAAVSQPAAASGTPPPVPVLRFGPKGQAPATWSEVVPQHNVSGPGQYVQFRALLTNLTSNATYAFQVTWKEEGEEDEEEDEEAAAAGGGGASVVDGRSSSRAALAPPRRHRRRRPPPPSASGEFRVPPASLDWSPRVVMFGDLGWTDNQVLPFLREECEAGAVDAMVVRACHAVSRRAVP